ncbi:MAG: ABC transporter permease [Lachnospiraceae bacterium]|nr:ABC transporter permease [Lachnospiraceae bacterium]
MKILDLLQMSLSSLFKRKVRTILTVLGVVIGTTSIVVMISLGIGMKAALLDEMQSYASLTNIEVTEQNRYYDGDGGDDKKKEELHLDDALVEALSQLDHVVSVDPEVSCSAFLKCNGYIGWGEIKGVTPEYLKNQKIELASGELPTSETELSFLYGNTVLVNFSKERGGNDESYWETGELPPIDLTKDSIFAIFDMDNYYNGGSTDENGQVIPMPKKHLVKTAGVMAGGPEDWSQHSYYVYCNLEALKTTLTREFKGRTIPGQPTRKNGKPYKEFFYSTVNVSCDTMESVEEVQQIINDMGYQTYSSAEWIESDMQMMNIIQAVLGGIGGISLLVAAIGITNTMMMSIYERTKEIGIMKVIGCRIRDIQALFLIEAGYIGLIGGTVGVLFSYLISMVLNKLAGGADVLGFGAGVDISRIPLWLATLSILFAILIAMIAGFFPSVRAMKLSPLAAIRAE